MDAALKTCREVGRDVEGFTAYDNDDLRVR